MRLLAGAGALVKVQARPDCRKLVWGNCLPCFTPPWGLASWEESMEKGLRMWCLLHGPLRHRSPGWFPWEVGNMTAK